MSQEKLKRIEELANQVKLQFAKNSFSHLLGAYKTLFRGKGLSFKGHRGYEYGDDIRFLDWKVYAKSERFFIKTFEEERQLDIAVIIDAGANMQYGGNGISKFSAAINLTSLLMFIAEKTKDRVHPYLVTDKIVECAEGNLRKKIEKLYFELKHFNLVNEIGEFVPNYQIKSCPQRNIEKLIQENIEKKRVIFLISDFYYFIDIEFLKRVIHHDRIIFSRILSPLDEFKKLNFMLPSSLNKIGFGHLTGRNISNQSQFVDSNMMINRYKVITDENYLENFLKRISYAL